jgi:ketosteroid isomerase-like protein
MWAGMPRAERHVGRHFIDHLEEVWRTAILHGNITAMEALLADDYMAITPSGTLQSKEQTLANLRAGTVHFKSIDVSDRKVRFYGMTALVTSRAEVNGTGPEGDLSGSYRYTRVYVRDERGVWRIVSFEANRIREPGERK